jgi:hypothetical protein
MRGMKMAIPMSMFEVHDSGLSTVLRHRISDLHVRAQSHVK